MRVTEVKKVPQTTADCVEILMECNLIPYKWKRTAKYKFGRLDVRVFKNEDNEYNTIVSQNGEETRIFNNLNFTDVIPLVNHLKNIAKFYYTHDYGAVFLNPYTLDLYAVGGDGGYAYSTKPKSVVQQMFENDELDLNDDEDFIEFNEHVGLESLNSVEWEAETSPDDPEFIEICEISLLE
jgi:hypothetical protein